MRTLALVGVILLGACKGDSGTDTGTPPSRNDAILALTGDAAHGQEVYTAEACGSCHGATGGGGIGPVIGTTTDPETMVDNLLNGKGAMTSYAELSDQDLADLVAYVTGGFAG
jgi:mono/diheme cytochrome c family protein